MGKEISRKKKKTTKTDDEIEAITNISRAKHENRNGICNELPTGKLKIKPGQTDTMLYVDDAKREWRRNPDLMASYHQPMSMPNALFHSIIDAVIFCVDFPGNQSRGRRTLPSHPTCFDIHPHVSFWKTIHKKKFFITISPSFVCPFPLIRIWLYI